MHAPVAGMTMQCSEISQVLATTLLKIEPNIDVINFDTKISQFTFNKKSSVSEVLRSNFQGGGTDCSLPLLFAKYAHDQQKIKYDAIIIFTDNETWAGKKHGLEYYNEYVRKVNPNLKVVEVCLQANSYSQFPPEYKNVLRVVGFDSSVIEVINKFIGE
jgi:60 kDa SS-A/Ro ribonucleoprotein